MAHYYIWLALKCCLGLTIARLASTAFGLEFGVSRQYLRLLEWVFELGQRRVEKVESRHKLAAQQQDDAANCRNTSGGGGAGESKLDGKEEDDDDEEDANLPRAYQKGRQAKGQEDKVELSKALSDKTNSAPKSRRISTPDGPPVFLLDDFDEDDDVVEQLANSSQAKHEFHLEDATKLIVRGISCIIDDQVTKRFTQEELKTWNLLTRTDAKNYHLTSRSLGLCWLFGFLIRYTILMPLRIMFTLTGFFWLIGTMTLIGLLPKAWRLKPFKLASLMSFRMLSCGITSRLRFHNRQFRAQNGEICVANHTSPLDVVLLACDNYYALVGQRHGGLLGVLEKALSRATNHVWFDRGEFRDRQLVTQRLREHLSSKFNLPVLIFPEGTCINNSAVMMFRKGSFETTDRVCPVAIKYDARFGDPFWNSSRHSYLRYLLLIMSSWAIKCDVWYLAPMDRLPAESSAEFANRVKAQIAKQGGLVDLAWDGQLKRSSVKRTWLFQQQEDYANRLKLD